MIKNEKQYQVTKSRLNDFKVSLKELEKEGYPLLKKLHYKALQSQINKFEKEIEEYELLKEGSLNYLYANDLSEISEILIKARIANRLTQAELAERLKLKEQQIQRYEISNYSTANFNRIIEIAYALELRFDKMKIKVREAILAIPEGIDQNVVAKIRNRKSLLNL